MSRDFEFKQLLRAYRSGIISKETFESEMACMEAGAPTRPTATEAARHSRRLAALTSQSGRR